MRYSNVLDPIHHSLDPRVWQHAGAPKPVLKASHAHWIKKQVYATLDQGGYSDIEKWLSLVFTGSLTTYQYSDDSDVDISLFVDTKVFPEWSRAEMIALMVEHLDGTQLPGTPFPLQNFVVPVGIKPHDLYKPGLRSGYDLDTNTWLVPPDHSRVHDVEHEEKLVYMEALAVADKMEKLLQFEPEQATELWHEIHEKRKRDMQAGLGDYARSNIVYKFLAKRGLMPAISDASGEYIAKAAAIDTQDFFTQAQEGNRAPGEGLKPEHISQDPHDQQIYGNQQQYYGPFDRHIETSIPDFRNNSLRKERALLGMGGGRLLDIAGSTGSFGKSLSDLSGGSWQTDNLEPNPAMNEHFKHTPVEGARVIPQTFGESFGGYPQFQAEQPYDVVHESMGFQFMHPDRNRQVEQAKALLHPSGLFLSEEKFHTPNEAENERIKDEQFKNQYYTPEELQDKNKEVGFQGQGPMNDNLAQQEDYENTLRNHFAHVAPYWQSGNFAGYAASNDSHRLEQFLKGYPQARMAKTAAINKRKFVTTTKDHEKGKRKWGIPKPHRWRKVLHQRKGAVDPEFLNRWIEENGPYAIHEAGDWSAKDKILQEGIIPHDAPGHESAYNLDLVPRANHVYLRTPTPYWYEHAAKIDTTDPYDNGSHRGIVIDLRKLDPERINADEDAFSTPHVREAMNKGFPTVHTLTGRDATSVPHNTKLMSQLGEAAAPIPMNSHPDWHHVQDETGTTYRHYGEFADKRGLNDPAHVAFSMNRLGNIAVEGGVDPEAFVDTAHAWTDLNQNYPHFIDVGRTMDVPYPLTDDSLEKGDLQWVHKFVQENPHLQPPGYDPQQYVTASLRKEAGLADNIYHITIEGGGTAMNLAGEPPLHRYGFAVNKAVEHRVPLDEFTPVIVNEYIDHHIDELNQPNRYIGTWVSDGVVVLDVTEGEDDKDTAYEHAWNNEQQSMWDHQTGSEIPVRGLDYEPENPQFAGTLQGA